MSQIKFLGQKELPIGDLKPHAENPNRGDINAIAESLEQFGQYRSVVVLKDLTIVAGHHVVQAAKNLGMKMLRVEIIDTDATTATKILLADNRLADLGLGPDLDILFKDLEELDGDLLGTGFDDAYLKLLTEAVTPPEPQEPDTDAKTGTAYRKLSLTVDSRLADQWDAHRKLFSDDTSAFGYLFG